ncbi:MAG: phytoene desaturase [Chloroflexi bacterium]|nr:phytoene desaturase [Chloroflexota bacterium]
MVSKVIIIGAGFGGLAAAVRLAARGHTVEIYEKQDKPGGKAYVLEVDGFRFDTGPTVITAPFLFDDLWRAAGRRREDYFELRPCDPFYRIYDHTGRWFDHNADETAVLRQIERISPPDVDGYRRFLASTRPIFQKGFVELADQPFLRFGDMVRVAPDLARLRSFESVYRYVSRYLQDDFLRRCFSFHPLFIGGNPFHASSIYAMVHYLEREWGVYYAVGGTGAIVAALVRLLHELGVVIHLNAEVRELIVAGRRIAGVALADGTVRRADVVVSNADVAHTYADLIEPRHRRHFTDRRLRAMRYSMSLVVLYLGTRRTYHDPRLVRHNIMFGPRYRELLDDIFARKRVADDFSLYLHMPSRDQPEVAPPGCDAFYVLSPVPNLASGADWATLARPYRDMLVRFLEERFLPELSQHIVVERMMDPRDFQRRQNSYLGAAFALEPTLLQSAWFRPHNRSEEFENLYFVGAGTHPGAGIPGVLSSAVILERLVER